MIVTELYDGQGIGNQLWCYFVTRTIADNLGFQYGIMRPDKFKGIDFMKKAMVVNATPASSRPLQNHNITESGRKCKINIYDIYLLRTLCCV